MDCKCRRRYNIPDDKIKEFQGKIEGIGPDAINTLLECVRSSHEMEIEESENPEKYKPYTRQMGKNAKEVTLMKSLFELYGGPAGIRTPDLHLVRRGKLNDLWRI
ncbi:hypothetical protein DRN38_01805, partial [Thermococci archaeon]